MTNEKITIYDSTLRDGVQSVGVDFSVVDKIAIAEELANFGIDYIEGGWPGANVSDDKFYDLVNLSSESKLTAFGMTRRDGYSAANDPGLNALLQASKGHLCIVGKASAYQAQEALQVSLDNNLQMIHDSVSFLHQKKNEVTFDAEHFFDGYKDNPEYSLKCLLSAREAGAQWLVLCDTNGGCLPHEIQQIVSEVIAADIDGSQLGIHAHNDSGNAVANSLAAIQAGVRQIQGTINGIGERCGNADLITILANIALKTPFHTSIPDSKLQQLTQLSRMIDERLQRPSNPYSPYVGYSAFAHKGGLHGAAIKKNPHTYEHVNPDLVGNKRHIIISQQSGQANIHAFLEEKNIHVTKNEISKLLKIVKEYENNGYAFEQANASFEMFVLRHLNKFSPFFDLIRFRVIDDHRINSLGNMTIESEASVRLLVRNQEYHNVAVGNGPVNALDNALVKTLAVSYPALNDVVLHDYKVRIIPLTFSTQRGSDAVVRVSIEWRLLQHTNDDNFWYTTGVSTNVIEASYRALEDSYNYCLLKQQQTQIKKPTAPPQSNS